MQIKSVCWDSQGEYLASCGRDKTIWVWDKDEGYEYSCNSILNGHSQVNIILNSRNNGLGIGY